MSTSLGTVSIAGFDLGAVARRLAREPDYAGWLHDTFEPQMGPLGGASADELFAEAAEAGDAWYLCVHAGRFAERPVLLLAATNDEEVPVEMHHVPMVEAFERAGARLTHRIYETDHAFSDRRIELAETIARWLGALTTTRAVHAACAVVLNRSVGKRRRQPLRGGEDESHCAHRGPGRVG